MKLLNIIITLLFLIGCKENESTKRVINDLNETEGYRIINDTLTIKDKEVYLLLYPSNVETKNLKEQLGEEEFYLSADTENGYSSVIFKILKEKNKKYINTDKKVIYFKDSGIIINKADLNNSWGVISYMDNKFSFRKSIDFIEYMNNEQKGNLINCEFNSISQNYTFSISSGKTDQEEFIIDIENKKNQFHQLIKYRFNYLLDNNISCTSISYFKKDIQIIEGVEDFHDFIIADFNFDQLEDFAILFDSGGNGGPLFSYFIQNKNGQFLKQEKFPLQESCFPKEINEKDKVLKTVLVRGCCKLISTSYQLNSGEWKIISNIEKDM